MEKFLRWLIVIKDYAKDYILENTGLKFLALLITAVLWLSIAARPQSQITLPNVPITFNLPVSPDLTFSQVDTDSVRVYMTGPRDVLETIRPSDITAYADLTGVEPGLRVIPLKLDLSRVPASVEATALDPRSVRLTIERIEDREVSVTPRFEGAPPPGYEIYGWSINPPVVHIHGAASMVRGIEKVSTETVSLDGKTQPFTQQVAIDIGSPDVNISDNYPRKVLLELIVGETREERVIERVPVTVDGEPSARVSPRFVRVKVFGPRSKVQAFTPADLSVSVSYSGRPGQWTEVTPIVTVSDNAEQVAVSSIEPKTVRVR